MQKSKKSLIIGLSTLILAIILTIIFLLKDTNSYINLNDLSVISKSQNPPKELILEDGFLHFRFEDKIYKFPLFFLDYKELDGLKSSAKIIDGRSNSYLFFISIFVILILIIGLVIYRKNIKKIKVEKEKNGTFENPKNISNEAKNTQNQHINFSKVAGISAAKKDLLELSNLIKNPSNLKTLDISMPKGVLLVGPPGVGKTLIAKAFANEAKVPFYYQSGSSFVEIYTGLGAKKVRELFNKAKQNAPCIIFIDEIDAIGKKRGGNRSDERESTLNELLTQIDGFEENSGVLLLGATNHIKNLDNALLRSGRFDRKIFLELPDFNDRIEILNVHLRAKNHKIDINKIAKNTAGFSGSDLSTLVNEAALLALKNKRSIIETQDLESLKDSVLFGSKSITLSSSEKEIMSIYKAAKALCALLFELDFERVNLIGEFNIFEDFKAKSAQQYIALIKLQISGIIGVEVLKNEPFYIKNEDIKKAKKMLSNLKNSRIYLKDSDINLEQIYKEHVSFLTEHKDAISAIAKELITFEHLEIDVIKKLKNDYAL